MRNLETDFSLRRQKMDVPSHSSSLCLKIYSDYSVIRGTEGRNLTLLLVIWGFAKHSRSTTVLRKIIFRVAEEVRNKENKTNLWSQFGEGGTLRRKSNLRTREEVVYLFLLISFRFELDGSISSFFILITNFLSCPLTM